MFFDVPADVNPTTYMFDTAQMELQLTFNTQIYCRKNRKDATFYPVATIQYKMTLLMWVVLLPRVRIDGHIYTDGTSVVATQVLEQEIAEVDLEKLNQGLETVTEALIAVSNKYLSQKLSLMTLQRYVPFLCALDIRDTVTSMGYRYLAVMFSPIYTFNEDNCVANNNSVYLAIDAFLAKLLPEVIEKAGSI